MILDGLCGDLYFDLDDVDKTLRGVRFQALSSDKADNGEALPAIIAAVRRMEEELKEIHGAPVGTEGSVRFLSSSPLLNPSAHHGGGGTRQGAGRTA